MGDPGRSGTSSSTTNFYSILGIPKSATLAEICKAHKSLVKKWHPDRNASNRLEAEEKFRSINEAYKGLTKKKREEANGSNYEEPKSPLGYWNPGLDEELIISSPELISTTSTRVTPTGTPRTLSTSPKQGGFSPIPQDFQAFMSNIYEATPPTTPKPTTPPPPPTPTPTPTPTAEPIGLSKIASKRNPTPIIFSQSTARRKPKPIEKKLECTLEELCNGCVKKVKITRDVISNEGLIVEEQETLKIKIKPGWKKGTKITFEGKGDEKPGMHPADIIFIIDEKRHPIFKREGDDLELGVEIPLIQALTGCEISVPLLGGDKMTISIDDEIIYPGYEHIIPGQGMPKSKHGSSGLRGDLMLRFLVEFPDELSDEQRSELVDILGDCS